MSMKAASVYSLFSIMIVSSIQITTGKEGWFPLTYLSNMHAMYLRSFAFLHWLGIWPNPNEAYKLLLAIAIYVQVTAAT